MEKIVGAALCGRPFCEWPCPDFVDTELGYFGIPKRFWADMPDR
jgi:hypothetical protein